MWLADQAWAGTRRPGLQSWLHPDLPKNPGISPCLSEPQFPMPKMRASDPVLSDLLLPILMLCDLRRQRQEIFEGPGQEEVGSLESRAGSRRGSQARGQGKCHVCAQCEEIAPKPLPHKATTSLPGTHSTEASSRQRPLSCLRPPPPRSTAPLPHRPTAPRVWLAARHKCQHQHCLEVRDASPPAGQGWGKGDFTPLLEDLLQSQQSWRGAWRQPRVLTAPSFRPGSPA